MNIYQFFFSLIGSRTEYLLYDKVRAMKITRKLRIFSVAISNFMRLSAVYVFISRNPCIKNFQGLDVHGKRRWKIH